MTTHLEQHNNTSTPDAWQGNQFYATCAKQVHAAKMRAFPKGAIRRGQSQSLGLVATPFGTLSLSVTKSSEHCLSIEHCTYMGRLTDAQEMLLGQCEFSLYRVRPGQGWLADKDIFWDMDAATQEAADICEIAMLDDNQRFVFEYEFNTAGLFVAELLYVAPEARGPGVWRTLYFATMSALFAHRRFIQEEFIFKAHPLLNSSNLKNSSDQEIARKARELRLFYSVQLNAERIYLKGGTPTDYMRAEVPNELRAAWYTVWQEEEDARRNATKSGLRV